MAAYAESIVYYVTRCSCIGLAIKDGPANRVFSCNFMASLRVESLSNLHRNDRIYSSATNSKTKRLENFLKTKADGQLAILLGRNRASTFSNWTKYFSRPHPQRCKKKTTWRQGEVFLRRATRSAVWCCCCCLRLCVFVPSHTHTVSVIGNTQESLASDAADAWDVQVTTAVS